MAAPEDWVGWQEATKLAGCSRRQLNRYCARGVIQRMQRNGQLHYSRAECLQLAAGEIELDDDEPDMVKLVQQYHRTIEHLLEPAKMFGQLLLEENKSLRERIGTLETKNDEAVKAREVLLDGQTERQLLLDAAAESEKRKAFAMAQLAQLIPLIRSKLGGAAADLLQSLNEDQLQLLLETDLISDQQKQLLRACLPSKPSDASEQADTTPANGAPS